MNCHVIEKEDKKLKTVPAALKTLPEYKEMIVAKKTIADQLRRIRASLENAMTSKDTFTVGEIKTITAHPLIENYFGRLIIVDTKGLLYKFSPKNKTFISVSGKEMTLLDTEIMRVAHAYDLYQSNQWTEWQQLFFDQKIIQPFKQLFRELYLVTEEEKKEGNFSRRYAGHQVQPKQALALLRTRGWVANPDSGVFKVFHDANLTVSIGFRGDLFTPSEVEGLTLEAVIFYNKDDGKVIKIEDVDPLLFSEIMRDIDLIVSVAHMGDIDPEASQSTVEMRATLVRETARLLQFQNVRIEKSHVFVTGKLAEYTVHLGSAVTHVLPGGMLFVVPVHSQQNALAL